jgi:RNA polymerase sigma-B factor
MGTMHAVGSEARARLDRDRALFKRYASNPTRQQRDALIARFMPLARALAARYTRAQEPFEDLVQVATLGLVKAIDRYDVTRGTAFSSYAAPTITGEIKRYFRDRTWSVRVPRDLQELALAVQATRAQLESRLGRPPTVAEIAEKLEVSDEEILEAMNASFAQYASSLDQRAKADGEDNVSMIDLIATPDREVEIAEARVVLTTLLSELSKRSRVVLLLRFQADMTQAEIGEIIGVSQMQVSRIIRESLDQLRSIARTRAQPPTRCGHNGRRRMSHVHDSRAHAV